MEDSIARWGKLTSVFDQGHKFNVNAELVWPIMLDFIASAQSDSSDSRPSVLDFGCGTGTWAAKLSSIGCDVTGVDYSDDMIASAMAKEIENAQFVCGDSQVLAELESFDLATAIMAFQFVKDIEQVLDRVVSKIKPGGGLIFAVHNPDWVQRASRMDFEGYSEDRSLDAESDGQIGFGNGNIFPVYVRTAEHYDELLEQRGFTNTCRICPSYPPELVAQHEIKGPTDVGIHMVLGYQHRGC